MQRKITIWHLLYFWCVFCPALVGGAEGYPLGGWSVFLGLAVGGTVGCMALAALHATLRCYGPSCPSCLAAFMLLFGAIASVQDFVRYFLQRH